MTKSATFTIYTRNAIQALQEHMVKAHACAEALMPFLEAVLAQDWLRAESLHLHITNLEHQADTLKKDLRLNVSKSFFLPAPKAEILELITAQDLVANRAKDISGLILSRQMGFPPTLVIPMHNFIQRSIDTSAQAERAISELDELIETSFQERTIKSVEGLIHELDDIEQDTDEMQLKLRKQIFKLETELSAIEIIFLYKLIDKIGDLADRAQQVGERMQMMLAH